MITLLKIIIFMSIAFFILSQLIIDIKNFSDSENFDVKSFIMVALEGILLLALAWFGKVATF